MPPCGGAGVTARLLPFERTRPGKRVRLSDRRLQCLAGCVAAIESVRSACTGEAAEIATNSSGVARSRRAVGGDFARACWRVSVRRARSPAHKGWQSVEGRSNPA